jgi:hypothetical protein
MTRKDQPAGHVREGEGDEGLGELLDVGSGLGLNHLLHQATVLVSLQHFLEPTVTTCILSSVSGSACISIGLSLLAQKLNPKT